MRALWRRIALTALDREQTYKRSLRQKMKRTAMDNNYMIQVLSCFHRRQIRFFSSLVSSLIEMLLPCLSILHSEIRMKEFLFIGSPIIIPKLGYQGKRKKKLPIMCIGWISVDRGSKPL
ncbi:hypothetical protein [Moorena sp. SIO4E2]|nr:hypothetical protein [Moorena sp. SIO4E2]